MKLPRRRFLHLAAGAAALPIAPHVARAQVYPSRPMRIMLGFATGGAQDLIARLIGQRLAERFGQPVIVENRPGAGGNVATEIVVRAAPDGYTLLLVAPPHAINPALYAKLNFNFINDIAPVAGITRQPSVMQVQPSFAAATVPEFIAYAKNNPGKINMASAGMGTAGHVAGELFQMMTGTKMVHGPYRGGAPALTDLLGGQVDVFFAAVPGSIGHIRNGRLRALAVTTAARTSILPETPTVAEFVAGYEASGWYGVGAPRNTPAEIVEKLNAEINTALADLDIKGRLAELGGDPLPGSPADFSKLVIDETEKWGKVVKFAGIKPV